MSVPSPAPARFPAGISTDFPFGPLASFGLPNPFFYHVWADDFNILAAEYTATKTNAGTIASAAADGGVLLFTTDTATSDLASLQLPAAAFTLTAGKKSFFLCRLKVSSAANTTFKVGLIQTTTTPNTVTDGIYFGKATGSAANLTLFSVIGSAATSVAIPTAAYTLADATYIDLGWYVDRNGDVHAYVGSNLVGYTEQDSATSLGTVARLTSPSLTTATLNPTLSVTSGTGTAKTMTVDFAMAAKER